MRALSVGQPGEVEWIELADPVAGAGEVVVAPLACGICTTDVKMVARGRDGDSGYALGHEVAGRIVAADPAAGWQVGQRVVFAPYLPCGACYYCLRHQPTLCVRLFETYPIPGGLAERVRLPRRLVERGLFAVADGLPDEAAALAEPIGCAVKGVADSGVRAGDSVLVVGDGPMGVICAVAARAAGARPVIVAGLTPHRLEAAARHFADAPIHVGEADLRTAVLDLTSGRGADVVLVAVSEGGAVEAGLSALRPGGTLNAFAGVPKGTEIKLDLRRLHYQQFHLTGSFGVGPEHLAQALHLIQSGLVDTGPLITGRFAFAEAPDAVAYAANRTGLKAMVLFDGQEAG
jgi:L-iditol 2-dehydrogenase